MSSHLNNECVAVAIKEIEEAGYKAKVEHRGKHLAVVWEQGGQPTTYFVPSSPSDRRAWLNCRADVRRMLRVEEPAGEALPSCVPKLMATERGIVTSTREVASAFDKRHDHVLRDVDNLLKVMDSPDLGNALFVPAMEQDGGGVMRRVYHVSRDGFALLSMGFSGAKALRFKLAFIQAFNAMEHALSGDRERLAISAATGDMKRLEADLSALTDLVLERGSAQPEPSRRRQFIRPSVLRRQRLEARRA